MITAVDFGIPEIFIHGLASPSLFCISVDYAGLLALVGCCVKVFFFILCHIM